MDFELGSILGFVLEKLLKKVPGKVPGKVLKKVPGKVPEKVPEKAPGSRVECGFLKNLDSVLDLGTGIFFNHGVRGVFRRMLDLRELYPGVA